MKKPVFILSICAILISLIATSFGCVKNDDSKLHVVTSTTLIEYIVDTISGGEVDVVNIIPPAQCPGHFDVKPGDIAKLSKASLFLFHGWQGEKFSADVINSANNPKLVVERLDIEGNWMVPAIQIAAAEKITRIMGEVDVENKGMYEKNFSTYKSLIESKAADIKAELSGKDLSFINVLCADQQAGFVKWIGLNIVSTFGRPESLTPQILKDLVDKGKESDIVLVIDNLQSGPDAGKAVAEELRCHRVVISNFPGGFSNTETWSKTMDKNIDIILTAVGK